jgi:hypothetical protein
LHSAYPHLRVSPDPDVGLPQFGQTSSFTLVFKSAHKCERGSLQASAIHQNLHLLRRLLVEAEAFFALGRDHLWIPRRVPDQIDVGFADAGQRHQLVLGVKRD